MLGLVVILIGCFAALSFYSSAAETAFFSLRKWQMRRLVMANPVRSKITERFMERPDDLLAMLVWYNTIANAGIVALMLWIFLFQSWSLWYGVLPLLIILLVLCEVVPKTLAVRSPARWTLRLAGLLPWLEWCFSPVHRLTQAILARGLNRFSPVPNKQQPGLSNEEYQELLDLACQQGTLEATERDLIMQIIHLDKHTVKEIMRPRSRMACISDDLTIEEMVSASQKWKHRRLPMYDEEADTIVGILNTRTLLLNPEVDLLEAIEFPSFVPDSMNVLQLFKSLQKQQRGIAIVLDEFGGTAGLITMEDILEEVIGEIRSELQATGFVFEKLGAGRWKVSGTMRQDDFRREYLAMASVPDVETMGGIMIHRLQVVPSAGESIQLGNLRLTATKVDERRIKEILVEVVSKTGGGTRG